MGATQFRLLSTLGLRARHRLLDFGCGSLRAGRLFIPYLNEGCYYGAEPNRWLVEGAIREQIGQGLVTIKGPRFQHNDDFSVSGFSVEFDFILAQSICSHTGGDLVNKGLNSFRRSLKDDGIIAVTFKEGSHDFQGAGWVYPKGVKFRRSTIKRFVEGQAFLAPESLGIIRDRIGMSWPKTGTDFRAVAWAAISKKLSCSIQSSMRVGRGGPRRRAG